MTTDDINRCWNLDRSYTQQCDFLFQQWRLAREMLTSMIVDPRLNFNEHMSTKVKQARRLSGMMIIYLLNMYP